MARHSGELKPGPETVFDENIAVADATASTFTRTDQHLVGISRSTNSQSPPGLLTCAAFIFVLMRLPPLSWLTASP